MKHKIITISREFGSGGRELGKRLSDVLGITYYDREIITMIAEKTELNESYVSSSLEKSVFSKVPYTFSRTFSRIPSLVINQSHLLGQQSHVVKELAETGNCIIIGRSADAILAEHTPLRIFVYADMDAKITRCQQRATDQEHLSAKEIEFKIKQIDAARAEQHHLVSNIPWGDKRGYDFCINTSHIEIKEIVPHLASYLKDWLNQKSMQ